MVSKAKPALGLMLGAMTAGVGLLPPWDVLSLLCIVAGSVLIAQSAALFGQSCHRKDF